MLLNLVQRVTINIIILQIIYIRILYKIVILLYLNICSKAMFRDLTVVKSQNVTSWKGSEYVSFKNEYKKNHNKLGNYH